MKVYLAHAISTTAEFNDSIRVAETLESMGYKVYAAARNKSINNKSNNPTPIDIYNADVNELLSSDIVVVNLNGGHQDGTITEIGAVAGYNEALNKPSWPKEIFIKIIGYTSNARLLQPQFHKGIPSASGNHLTLGSIEKWGEFVGSEQDMIEKMKSIIKS